MAGKRYLLTEVTQKTHRRHQEDIITSAVGVYTLLGKHEDGSVGLTSACQISLALESFERGKPMLKQWAIKLAVGLVLLLTLLFGGTLSAGLEAQATPAHPRLLACAGENAPPCE
jgi:hypothetical protein